MCNKIQGIITKSIYKIKIYSRLGKNIVEVLSKIKLNFINRKS